MLDPLIPSFTPSGDTALFDKVPVQAGQYHSPLGFLYKGVGKQAICHALLHTSFPFFFPQAPQPSQSHKRILDGYTSSLEPQASQAGPGSLGSAILGMSQSSSMILISLATITFFLSGRNTCTYRHPVSVLLNQSIITGIYRGQHPLVGESLRPCQCMCHPQL